MNKKKENPPGMGETLTTGSSSPDCQRSRPETREGSRTNPGVHKPEQPQFNLKYIKFQIKREKRHRVFDNCTPIGKL